jgi:hypothetical protein
MGPLIVFTGILFSATILILITGLIPVTVFCLVYFVYVISTILLCHFIFCGLAKALANGGRSYSAKTIPKYLDYAYILIIAVSLFQIFFFAPHMADYVTWLQGDEPYLANEIKAVAE